MCPEVVQMSSINPALNVLDLSLLLTHWQNQNRSIMQSYHQTAKTEYVSHGDIKYAYRRLGQSSGVPLLCLIHHRGEARSHLY
jgi:hypothetical protein